MLRQHGSAELTLYGDGCDPASEQLIRAACRVRRQYFPGAAITFVEIGSGQGQRTSPNSGGAAGSYVSGIEQEGDGGTLDEREYLIVRGTVQQIVFSNEENGYAVLRLFVQEGC